MKVYTKKIERMMQEKKYKESLAGYDMIDIMNRTLTESEDVK